jgi:hypothetical protein
LFLHYQRILLNQTLPRFDICLSYLKQILRLLSHFFLGDTHVVPGVEAMELGTLSGIVKLGLVLFDLHHLELLAVYIYHSAFLYRLYACLSSDPSWVSSPSLLIVCISFCIAFNIPLPCSVVGLYITLDETFRELEERKT